MKQSNFLSAPPYLPNRLSSAWKPTGERFGKGHGYRFQTVLQRTGADYEIDLDVTVTPLGAISRLEHALDDFNGEQQRYQRRLEDAGKRLVSYRSREGSQFAFDGDLAEKRGQLAEVEKALAVDASSNSAPGLAA